MHAQVVEFLTRMRARWPGLFAGRRVLECGAYNINGSARDLFSGSEYVGLDWRAGPSVDVVALTHTYQDVHGFDVVLSTEMLEHDPHWRASLANMARLVRLGGALLLTCASAQRPAHEVECAPEAGYYQGLSIVDVVTELRQACGWQHIHAEQHSAPADSYVACYGKQPLDNDVDDLLSIVVPAVGNVALTTACVASLHAKTGYPYDLILVDNGSKPENREALALLDTDVFLSYDRMLGYPAAINRGAAVARGYWLCLLNNDTEQVQAGWDAELLAVLAASNAAIVAPVTNFVANPAQQADGSTRGKPAYAADTLFFVCVVMRRTTFVEQGGLDEAFGLGNGEDKDFCLRVQRAGGKLVVVPSVFVHHVGHGTFRRLPEGMFQALLVRNEQRLAEKHREDQWQSS